MDLTRYGPLTFAKQLEADFTRLSGFNCMDVCREINERGLLSLESVPKLGAFVCRLLSNACDCAPNHGQARWFEHASIQRRPGLQ